MPTCNYCTEVNPRFGLYHPGDTEPSPRMRVCGVHVVNGIDELMFDLATREILVIEVRW